MTDRRLSLAALAGRTGRGVRVAVIDSGIHPSHPHVGVVQESVGFNDAGERAADGLDRLGHGTAVAAAIREKAPECELLCAKVFDNALATTGRALVAAIGWAVAHEAHLINLSLGTTNVDHEAALVAAVRDAIEHGTTIVAAAPEAGRRWLPGALDGVVGVELDWEHPRHECTVRVAERGAVRLRASGYPRPIPGVSPERNLKGPSFAVANATGLLALAREQEASAKVGPCNPAPW